MNLLILTFLIRVFIPTIEIESTKGHALYISVLEIDQEKHSIKVKVFANDLGDALYNFSQNRINLLGGNCLRDSALITDYFAHHLDIKINKEQLKFTLLSCEINDVSIWLNFNFNAKEQWNTAEVKADYLMELFPTQSNVVSINYKGEKKMFRLTKAEPKKEVEF